MVLMVVVLSACPQFSSAQVIGEIAIDCTVYQKRPIRTYEVVRNVKMGSEQQPLRWIFINVSEKDSRVETLISLGCQLSKQLSAEEPVTVYIFDHRRSAQEWAPLLDTFDVKGLRDPRVTYVLDREKGESYIAWPPDPMHQRKWLKINLIPSTTTAGAKR